jgi:hypothetical protein
MSFVLAAYPIDSAVLHKCLPVCSSKFCNCAIYTATTTLSGFQFTYLIYLYWVIQVEGNISTYCYRFNLESSGMWHGIWRVVGKVLKVHGNFIFRSYSPRAFWTSWPEYEGTVILQNVGNYLPNNMAHVAEDQNLRITTVRTSDLVGLVFTNSKTQHTFSFRVLIFVSGSSLLEKVQNVLSYWFQTNETFITIDIYDVHQLFHYNNEKMLPSY